MPALPSPTCSVQSPPGPQGVPRIPRGELMIQWAGPRVLPLFKLTKCMWARISMHERPKEIIFVDFTLLIYFCDKSSILYGIVLCQNFLSSQRSLVSHSRIGILAWILFGLRSTAPSRLTWGPGSVPSPPDSAPPLPGFSSQLSAHPRGAGAP